MSPLERAAREVCANYGAGGFCECVGGAMGCKNGRGEQRGAEGCVAKPDQLRLTREWGIARAVLQAIREPSEQMCAAGYNVGNWHDTVPLDGDGSLDATPVWQAMIDAALEEG